MNNFLQIFTTEYIPRTGSQCFGSGFHPDSIMSVGSDPDPESRSVSKCFEVLDVPF